MMLIKTEHLERSEETTFKKLSREEVVLLLGLLLYPSLMRQVWHFVILIPYVWFRFYFKVTMANEAASIEDNIIISYMSNNIEFVT